jgi:hypothetical protein
MQEIIAFKPYSLCPEEYRIPGVALSFPWVEQTVRSDAEAAELYAGGFILMTREQYDRYKRANSLELTVSAAIEASIDFGWLILREFSKDNVMLGITQAGMTARVRSVTADVINALSTGSLYDAIAQAKAIPAENKDPVFITDARLLKYVNMVEEYLGLTPSTTLGA